MSLRKSLFFIGLFLIIVSGILLSAEKEAESPVREYSVNFGLTYNSGNTSTTIFNVGGKVKLKNTKNQFNSACDVYYTKGDGDTTVDNGSWNNIFARSFSESFNYYVNLKFDYDKKKEVDLRSSLGFGLQYVIADNKKIESKVSTGLTGEHSNYGNGEDETNIKGEFMLYAKFNMNEKNTLSLMTSFTSKFKDFSDYRLKGIIELNAILSKNLYFKVKVVDKYDDNPVVKNIKNNDFMIVNALEFRF